MRVALICAGTGYMLHSQQLNERIIALYAGLSVIFLLTATSFTFTGFSLTLAYALEITFAIALTIHLRLPHQAVLLSCAAYILPIFTSLSDYSPSAWREGILHPSGYALYTIVLSTLFISVWALMHHRRSNVEFYQNVGGGFLILFWVYSTLVIWLVWGSLMATDDIANVLRFVSWSIVSYILTYVVLYARLPVTWVPLALATFMVPVTASITSVASSAWQTSATHPDAVGLYLLTTLFLLLGITFVREENRDAETKAVLSGAIMPTFVVAILYLVTLVWLVTHALLESDDTAVSAALFIYTVAGLALYTIGRSNHMRKIKLVGVVLLSGVILRLVLIDVWSMEMLGRIFTFLGIGLLFILTALFEKPFEQKKEETSQPPQDPIIPPQE